MNADLRSTCRLKSPSILHFDERGFCARTLCYQPGARHQNHAHDDLSVTLVAGGHVCEETEFGMTRSGIATVVVKPWETAHADVYGPNGLDTLQLRIRRDALPVGAGPPAYAWYAGGPLVRAMFDLLRACRDRVTPDLAEYRSHTRRVLNAIDLADPSSRPSAPPPWLERIAAALDRSFTSPVSTSRIAREANRHRVSLARAFRRYYRCSITEYIRRKRVHAACKAIEMNDRSLADIAIDVGFSDQAHFNRVFHRELGLTPGQLRRLIR